MGHIISQDEFQHLLGAAEAFDGHASTIPRSDMLQAPVWDSGFRARELLALRVGCVRFEDAYGARFPHPDMTS